MSILTDIQTVETRTNYVEFRRMGQVFAICDNANAKTVLRGNASTTSDIVIYGTEGLGLPAGTTTQRGSPNAHVIRYNTDDGRIEFYDTTVWSTLGPKFNELAPHRRTRISLSGSPSVDYTFLYGSAGCVLILRDVSSSNGASEMWMRFYINGTLQTGTVYDWAGRGYRGDAWNAVWEFRNCNKGGTGTQNEVGIALSPYGKIDPGGRSNWMLWIFNGYHMEIGGHVMVSGSGNYHNGTYSIITDIQGRCRVKGELTGVRVFTSEGSNFQSGSMEIHPLQLG